MRAIGTGLRVAYSTGQSCTEYIGVLDEQALNAIKAIENLLIANYPTTMNTRKLAPVNLDLVHQGDIPATIRFGPAS